ncbi:MAG: hypothetical protein IPI55_00645 [Flavobacteriales bacterium]|nr:hypothetical protein [Flavobacteriales bacterium]
MPTSNRGGYNARTVIVEPVAVGVDGLSMYVQASSQQRNCASNAKVIRILM